MKTMTEYRELVDREFASAPGHTRYCPGVPQAEEYSKVERKLAQDLEQARNGKGSYYPWMPQMDKAWIVCLFKANIITRETAGKIIRGIEATAQDSGNTEAVLTRFFDGDEDLGSVVNYGRTTQEPMSRLQLRDTAIGIIDDLLRLLKTVLDVAENNTDAIMPGHTHLSQAQPITLAHYLLSVYDGLERGLRQFELAYRDTNRNSGGCGACSGIAWPVDRWLLTRLLGFEDLVEPTYDCESAQDHSISLMFALTNISLLLSKVTIDMNIWGMEEVGMLHADPAWCGVSSMMPQKCIPGSQLERARIGVCHVIGEMMTGISLTKGEPHADMLPTLRVPGPALKAMAHASYSIGWMTGHLLRISPQKESMLEHVREGYSCATEIVVHMVRNLGYGGRRSHRIVANFVRMARERKLKAYETTGELLDEAARFAREDEPGISTETLRSLLDPLEFLKTHDNTGGVSPQESQRMIAVRRERMQEHRQRQKDRIAAIEAGREFLEQEVGKIIGSDS